MNYTSNDVCLACGHDRLIPVINLSKQPLANSYLHTPDEDEEEYPLMLLRCPECDHLQLADKVNPDLLFKNYLYVSGTSQTGLNHFKWFVGFSKTYVPNAKNVLDVACNDGSQLNQFADAGFETYGIDPAENLLELSSKRSKVICDYMNETNINSFGVKFDIIIAQNVFAHIDYPVDFLKYCAGALSDNGCVFIQTSQANMIANNEFDTIYHEHLSFFSVHSMIAIAKRCGLNLIDVRRPAIHGSSYLFVLSKSGIDRSDHFANLYPRYTSEQMSHYAYNAHGIVFELRRTLLEFRNQGYKIIGYGAAAKGNTLLNMLKMKLDYIVDDNPLKQGLYTPGMRIEIKHPDVLVDETSKIVMVPLAWNFFDEIKSKVESRMKNAVFVKYFPKVEVLNEV